jgi:tetratricopeptide (TPR) repeat protein
MHPTRMKLLSLAGALLAPLALAAQSTTSAVDQGVKLFEAKKYAEAKAQLAPAGKSSHVAAYYLGRIASEENDLDKAGDWFEQAIKMNEGSSVYHMWMGRVLCEKAQTANKLKQPFLAKNCRNEWERAIQLDPNNLDARSDIIEFYLQAPGIMGGSKDKARQEAQEIKKRDFTRGTAAAANVATRTQDFAGAEREWQSYIKSQPDSSLGHVMLAVTLTTEKKYDEALAVLDKRLAAKPDDKAALYGVGRLGAVSGLHMDRAETALKQYLADPPKQNPSLTGAHFRLGQIYQKKGDIKAARQEYETALRIEPKNQDAKKALEALK